MENMAGRTYHRITISRGLSYNGMDANLNVIERYRGVVRNFSQDGIQLETDRIIFTEASLEVVHTNVSWLWSAAFSDTFFMTHASANIGRSFPINLPTEFRSLVGAQLTSTQISVCADIALNDSQTFTDL